MFRIRAGLAGLGAVTLVGSLVAGGSIGATAAGAGETVMAGSVASFASAEAMTGLVARSHRLTIQLWLKQDEAGASAFATAVSTPGDPLFRHHLTPAGFAARYGASPAEAAAVASWLRSEGFTAIRADSGRSYVRATAPVATIDAALHTQLATYRPTAAVNAGPYPLRANDRPVSLPSSLAGSVVGVTGLDDAAPSSSLIRPQAATAATTAKAGRGTATPCSSYYGQKMVGGLPEEYGKTSFPTIVCGYSADQMRAAYDASSTDTGTGQTIALVELGLAKDMFLTLQDYAKTNHLPAPSSSRYEELSLGANSGSCGDPFAGEEQLDVEASHDMAPGAKQLVVGGDACNNGDYGLQGLFDADDAVIDGDGGHPLASAASNSWESGDESQPASVSNIEHDYLTKAAAEGVGMYFSAGDGSGVLEPSIDPYAIAVGGTSLGVGKTGNRLFETGWSTGANRIEKGAWALKGEDGASGGGPSIRWAQPGYQAGVVAHGLGTTRVAPDLSAAADPFTGMALGQLSFPGHGAKPVYAQIPIGGTSESAPLVAGIVVAGEQGQASSFGFINPAIYRLAGTDAFFPTLPLTAKSPALDRGVVCDLAEFANICGKPTLTLTTFDDQSPAMKEYTGQVTLPGYDTMTGLGTPDSPKLIAGLRRMDS